MRDGVDITERVAGDGRLRAAGGAPQERHDLGAGAGLVRGEGGAGRAVGDVLADGPLDGVVEVVGGLDVDEVHRLADLDGHGAGELAGAGAGRAVAGVDGERDVDGLAGLGVAAGEERDVAERILAGGGVVVELVSRLDGAAVVVAVVVGVERALVDGGDGALVKGHVVDGVVAGVALGGAQVAEEVALVEADAVALRDGVLDVLAHEVDDDAAGVAHGRAAARGGAGIAGRVQGEVQRDGLRGGLGVGDERHAIEVGDLGAGVERAGGIAGGHGRAAIVQRALRGGGQGEGHIIEGDIGIGLGLAGVAAGLSDLVHEVGEVALRELDGLTGHTVVVDVVVGLGHGHGAAVILASIAGAPIVVVVAVPCDNKQCAGAGGRVEIACVERGAGRTGNKVIAAVIGGGHAGLVDNIELVKARRREGDPISVVVIGGAAGDGLCGHGFKRRADGGDRNRVRNIEITSGSGSGQRDAGLTDGRVGCGIGQSGRGEHAGGRREHTAESSCAAVLDRKAGHIVVAEIRAVAETGVDHGSSIAAEIVITIVVSAGTVGDGTERILKRGRRNGNRSCMKLAAIVCICILRSDGDGSIAAANRSNCGAINSDGGGIAAGIGIRHTGCISSRIARSSNQLDGGQRSGIRIALGHVERGGRATPSVGIRIDRNGGCRSSSDSLSYISAKMIDCFAGDRGVCAGLFE